MSKASKALEFLPLPAITALKLLGENIATARKRRRQSQQAWASRLQVSVPTVRRMEQGDPSVAMGVYLTAAWLMNRHQALANALDPKEDLLALEQEVQAANHRHTTRAKTHG